jgi:putative transposase
MGETTQPASLASLSDRQREQAMVRFAVLQPYLEKNIPLARAVRDGDVALRTARRWLKRYRAEGAVAECVEIR